MSAAARDSWLLGDVNLCQHTSAHLETNSQRSALWLAGAQVKEYTSSTILLSLQAFLHLVLCLPCKIAFPALCRVTLHVSCVRRPRNTTPEH